MNIDKALCMALKEAISDERAAPPMYRKLKEQLEQEGLLTRAREHVIDSIIKEEENHERVFMILAKQTGCQISTIKEPRKLYADLPLVERIRLAKTLVSRGD